MNNILRLKEKVLSREHINKEEAMSLLSENIDELCEAANEIRNQFCDDSFDICTIINAKSGRCSENCKFCSQSAYHNTSSLNYPLLSKEEIIRDARKQKEQGVQRYSLVTSGRRLSDDEVDLMCETIKEIKSEVGISVCVSFGLLDTKQFVKLKNAGVVRVHNNLETSSNMFSKICTTHTYQDKIDAINSAKAAGLSVCSGGILGLGEDAEDRIDMAFTLKELGIASVPINLLNPIEGTPMEDHVVLNKTVLNQTIAIFRFVLPSAYIRLGGGRGLLEDKGRSCFESGANAAITGDMLTTSGISVQSDLQLISDLGFKVETINE